MIPIIAAGFVEVTDTPQAFFTALVVSLAYLFLILLPVFRLRRARREEKKGPVAVLVGTLLLPLAVREVAVLIQGQYWRDWHFIWLYLIASTLLVGACHSVAAIWRFIKKKAQPDGTDNSGAAPLRV
jgi:CDP-diglyceride synthetase